MVVQSSLETEPEGHTAVGLLIGVLAGAGVTVSIMQYVVVPIIPALPRLLGTSEANASWAITSTLLVAAVSMPIVGRLGDMFGKRRMILLCTSCVVVGSVVCGLTFSLVFVVIGRSLHGFGLGLVSLGLSLMQMYCRKMACRQVLRG